MKPPVLVRVEIPASDVPEALCRLQLAYELPDGTEVADRRALYRYLKQVRSGYYYRLEFDDQQTREQIAEWYEQAMRIVDWHAKGLL